MLRGGLVMLHGSRGALAVARLVGVNRALPLTPKIATMAPDRAPSATFLTVCARALMRWSICAIDSDLGQ
jgi:hypothetical protein